MNPKEKLITIGLAFLPFTELRFSFFGVGELIFLLIFFNQAITQKSILIKRSFLFSRFWISYIIIVLFGFSYNVFFKSFSGSFEGFLFDSSAYLLIFIVIILMENLIERRLIDVEIILKNVFFLTSIIFSCLYFISFYFDSLFGFKINKYHIFQPFATNLHHTAMFLSPIFFIGIYILENTKVKIHKISILILLMLIVLMTLKTFSFKASLGLWIGSLGYICIRIINFANHKIRFFLLFLIVSFTIIVIFLKIDFIINFLSQMFLEEDVGSGRSNIYQLAFEKINNSLIFGYGSGPQVYYGNTYWDAHQTFLTILLQGGIIALLVFIYFLFNIINKIKVKPSLFGCFIAIFIYIIGGDVLRRLPIWLILIFIFYSSKGCFKYKKV